MQGQEAQKQTKFSLLQPEILFFFNGITALLGWNAVLASFDYYNYVYSPYNTALWFPIPLFAAYMISGILFNWMSYVRSYRFLVTIGIVITNISLIILFIFSLLSKHNVQMFFGLSLVITFVIGFASNSAQLSFFAMINYLGEKTVSRFTVGTAASGLFLAVLRIIITGIFGSNESDYFPILLFLGIAIIFNFFSLSLNLKFFSGQVYNESIESKLFRNRKNKKGSRKQLLTDASNQEQEHQSSENNQKSYARLLWETFHAIKPYPLYIAFNFIFTFMLFPALTFEKKMDMNETWAILVFNLMYNIGDFIGKILGDFRNTFNSYSILFTFCSRLFFFYTIPIMDTSIAQDDVLLNNNIFPFFNQFLFALTNGFVINGSFILSFETSPDQYKKYAGILGGLSLQFGIMMGSFLAIPFESLVDPVTSS